MHTKSTRTTTATIVATEQPDCQLPVLAFPRTLVKEGVELARELPADIGHLSLAHGLLQDAHNSADVCRSFVGVHSLTLANLLEEVVQRGRDGTVRGLPGEVLGQPLWKLCGEVEPFAAAQVLAEGRKGGPGCPFRFGERAKLRPLPDPVYKLFVLHALDLPCILSSY
jgi:hypothetical protein